jgi:hypothetical protein
LSFALPCTISFVHRHITPEDRPHRLVERRFQVCQRHAILGTTRTGDARFDRAQVKFQERIERRNGGVVGAEQPLLAAVRFHQRHQVLRAPGAAQVGQRLGVDREEAAGRAVLRRHVGDGGAVGDQT